MMVGFDKKLQSVLLVSLVLLANAQRSSNNFKDVDIEELARQNKITKQILEAYIQKKLGIRNSYVRPPSIQDILPMNMKTKVKKVEEVNEEQPQDSEEQEDLEGQGGQEDQEGQEYNEDDSLQSVESEQIASIFDNEGILMFTS